MIYQLPSYIDNHSKNKICEINSNSLCSALSKYKRERENYKRTMKQKGKKGQLLRQRIIILMINAGKTVPSTKEKI